MYDIIYEVFHNDTLFFIQTLLGVLFTIVLIAIFLKRSNRDERGWKIFGKASLVTFIYFVVIVNFVAYVTGAMSKSGYLFDFILYGHILQFIYNSVIAIEIIAVIIFKIRE